MSKTILCVVALKDETQGLLEKLGADVLYVGIGKVNAALELSRALASRRAQGIFVSEVINFGTAGSSVFKTHELVECTKFVQRDMDVSALGFKPGETPFETIPMTLEVARRFPQIANVGVCGTGDSFETSKSKVACDVVDMEAYAFAKVCLREQLAFSSVKYITDGSDHNAHNDWKENLVMAAAKFAELYRSGLTF